MMTMQTPPGTWNPTVPTNGVNGHTRIQDAVSGVTPGVYGYANIPAGVVNTLGGIPQAYGTVNPYIQAMQTFGTTQPFGQINPFATLNPYAQLTTTPYQAAAYGLNPNLGYATAWNQPAAIHPFAQAYSQTTPFGGFVNPLVNPFVQAIQSTIHPAFNQTCNPAAAWQTQPTHAFNPLATLNPFATINPYQTINAYQNVNPFVAATQAVSPFVSGCLQSAAINPLTGLIPTQTPYPFINTLNSIPQTLANTISPFGAGVTHPVVAQQIAQATLANATTCGTTIDPITGTVVPVSNHAIGSFPTLAGHSTVSPFGLGVSSFQFDANLGTGAWGSNLWSHPAFRSWIGQHPLQAIAWQNALNTSRCFNPVSWNNSYTNPFTTPFVNPFTSPFITNSITPWAASLNTLNPYVRNIINHSFGVCGLNPLNPTNCIC